MGLIRNPKDILAGLLFIALALAFAYAGRDLPMGSSVRMGPGYFPLILSSVLGFFGIIVFIDGFRFEGEHACNRLARAYPSDALRHRLRC
jgi:putative tricarboxylic transport membrane protein